METVLSTAGAQSCWPVTDSSHVAAVRRAAGDMAAKMEFDATRAGELAIAVTEAATNILKHAGHGSLLLRALRVGPHRGVEVLAIDQGPGMASVAASMLDGRSTAGSYGVGLGAMRRMASWLDVYSAPGQGCVLAMALWPRGAAEQAAEAVPLQAGAVCLPIGGETECGDAWGLAWDATSAMVLVADGLGHGPEAAQAANAAVASALAQPQLPPGVLLQDAHAALRATRGAAVAVVGIDMLRDTLLMAGVGNIACHAWLEHDRRQLVSHNGIVGSNLRKVQEFGAAWGPHAMLLLHSDGLATRWNLDDYPGLASSHPAVVAALLYRDFVRGRDDATILVLRDHRGVAP